MDLSDLDIYNDLDAFHEEEERKTAEYLRLEEKYKESNKAIEALKVEKKNLLKEKKTIMVNFQNLLDTAKTEIKRKDTMIQELRKKVDDICFRRKNTQFRQNRPQNEVVSQDNTTFSTQQAPISKYIDETKNITTDIEHSNSFLTQPRYIEKNSSKYDSPFDVASSTNDQMRDKCSKIKRHEKEHINLHDNLDYQNSKNLNHRIHEYNHKSKYEQPAYEHRNYISNNESNVFITSKNDTRRERSVDRTEQKISLRHEGVKTHSWDRGKERTNYNKNIKNSHEDDNAKHKSFRTKSFSEDDRKRDKDKYSRKYQDEKDKSKKNLVEKSSQGKHNSAERNREHSERSEHKRKEGSLRESDIRKIERKDKKSYNEKEIYGRDEEKNQKRKEPHLYSEKKEIKNRDRHESNRERKNSGEYKNTGYSKDGKTDDKRQIITSHSHEHKVDKVVLEKHKQRSVDKTIAHDNSRHKAISDNYSKSDHRNTSENVRKDCKTDLKKSKGENIENKENKNKRNSESRAIDAISEVEQRKSAENTVDDIESQVKNLPVIPVTNETSISFTQTSIKMKNNDIDENSNHPGMVDHLNTPKRVALFDKLFGPSPSISTSENNKLLTNVLCVLNSDSTSTSPSAYSTFGDTNELEQKDERSNDCQIKSVDVSSYFTDITQQKDKICEEITESKTFFGSICEYKQYNGIPGIEVNEVTEDISNIVNEVAEEISNIVTELQNEHKKSEELTGQSRVYGFIEKGAAIEDLLLDDNLTKDINEIIIGQSASNAILCRNVDDNCSTEPLIKTKEDFKCNKINDDEKTAEIKQRNCNTDVINAKSENLNDKNISASVAVFTKELSGVSDLTKADSKICNEETVPALEDKVVEDLSPVANNTKMTIDYFDNDILEFAEEKKDSNAAIQIVEKKIVSSEKKNDTVGILDKTEFAKSFITAGNTTEINELLYEKLNDLKVVNDKIEEKTNNEKALSAAEKNDVIEIIDEGKADNNLTKVAQVNQIVKIESLSFEKKKSNKNAQNQVITKLELNLNEEPKEDLTISIPEMSQSNKVNIRQNITTTKNMKENKTIQSVNVSETDIPYENSKNDIFTENNDIIEIDDDTDIDVTTDVEAADEEITFYKAKQDEKIEGNNANKCNTVKKDIIEIIEDIRLPSVLPINEILNIQNSNIGFIQTDEINNMGHAVDSIVKSMELSQDAVNDQVKISQQSKNKLLKTKDLSNENLIINADIVDEKSSKAKCDEKMNHIIETNNAVVNKKINDADKLKTWDKNITASTIVVSEEIEKVVNKNIPANNSKENLLEHEDQKNSSEDNIKNKHDYIDNKNGEKGDAMRGSQTLNETNLQDIESSVAELPEEKISEKQQRYSKTKSKKSKKSTKTNKDIYNTSTESVPTIPLRLDEISPQVHENETIIIDDNQEAIHILNKTSPISSKQSQYATPTKTTTVLEIAIQQLRELENSSKSSKASQENGVSYLMRCNSENIEKKTPTKRQIKTPVKSTQKTKNFVKIEFPKSRKRKLSDSNIDNSQTGGKKLRSDKTIECKKNQKNVRKESKQNAASAKLEKEEINLQKKSKSKKERNINVVTVNVLREQKRKIELELKSLDKISDEYPEEIAIAATDKSYNINEKSSDRTAKKSPKHSVAKRKNSTQKTNHAKEKEVKVNTKKNSKKYLITATPKLKQRKRNKVRRILTSSSSDDEEIDNSNIIAAKSTEISEQILMTIENKVTTKQKQSAYPTNHLTDGNFLLETPKKTNAVVEELSPMPTAAHEIFYSDQNSGSIAESLLPRFNINQDSKYKDIDSRLQTMFQSPPYQANKTDELTTSMQFSPTIAVNEMEEESFNAGILRNSQTNLTIDETLSASIMASTTSTAEQCSLNDSGGNLDTKCISLNKSNYRMEKVSENVINVFITRKRRKKVKN